MGNIGSGATSYGKGKERVNRRERSLLSPLWTIDGGFLLRSAAAASLLPPATVPPPPLWLQLLPILLWRNPLPADQHHIKPGVPALMDLANDPRRRATSDDPAWKYGFWPDLERKDLLQCTLCGKIVHGGVRRLKQHFSGGSSDADKCPEASMEIRIEMHNSLNTRKFKAMERYIDEEDEAELQRRRSVIYTR
ncbi:uncharacterized protein [Triticum aestivum]|uniref:uncharacterized protein n=1 Tax=Triticum aestivum TaxID=4565 RepID=UPI001D027D68|nr:uncharacterized protein LOC123042148 [Triticum aestivum]